MGWGWGLQTQDFSEIQSRVRAEWTLDHVLEVPPPPRRAALSGLGGRCRGTYAAAWIVYVMYKRRERKEEGGGGGAGGGGVDFICSFGHNLSSMCEDIVCGSNRGANGHADRCDSVGPGPRAGEKCGDMVALGELRRRLLSA